MSQEAVNKAHVAQLMIMDDIHRVCVENGIKYYLIGGSALGAIRHGGFIPWDADIDIAMFRKDYEKFVKESSKYLNPRLECHSYTTDNVFTPPHALVVMKDSKVLFSYTDKNPVLKPQGVYVDILPLDYITDDLSLQEKHARDLKSISKLKTLKNSKIYNNDGVIKRILKHALRLIFKPFSWKYLNKKQQTIAMRFNGIKEPKLCCSTLSHYKYDKLTMPISVFGEPKEYLFEGRNYYGPEMIEEYLCRIFGDYHRLPSQDSINRQVNELVDVSY